MSTGHRLGVIYWITINMWTRSRVGVSGLRVVIVLYIEERNNMFMLFTAFDGGVVYVNPKQISWVEAKDSGALIVMSGSCVHVAADVHSVLDSIKQWELING